jgi:hypothetical protein
MMTFLVHGDFIINAQLLENLRLGKQRIESVQIINAIANGKGGWKNHPIVKAWKNHVQALKYYTNCIINEWVRRGHKNTIPLYELDEKFEFPWWASWERLHQSHRAMLLRKNPFYYKDTFEVIEEYNNFGYIWPAALSIENKDDPLDKIAHPIPDYLVHAVFCKKALKTGVNKGRDCNRLIRTKDEFCKIHNKQK